MYLKPIAYYHCPMTSKFGIPRQSCVVNNLEGTVELISSEVGPAALDGIEGFDFIWLLWGFSSNRKNSGKDTVRPPRLGGNRTVGVFASRSPYRPNPIGLSSVRLISRDGMSLRVTGADLMDGTPIYDIKPYLPYTDSHLEAKAGFTDLNGWKKLSVSIPEELERKLREKKGDDSTEILKELLSQDPRPGYQNDKERIYGMAYGDMDVRFKVDGDVLNITEIIGL